MNYEVTNLMNDTYQVNSYPDDADFEDYNQVFQGSLSDCEAYIRLHEQGYIVRLNLMEAQCS